MLDLAFVRANLPLVREKLRLRGTDPALIDSFDGIDSNRRQSVTWLERVQAERNEKSAQVAVLRQKGKIAESQDVESVAELLKQITPLEADVRQLKEKIEREQEHVTSLNSSLRNLLESLPNLPQDGVPPGNSEHDNECKKTWGDIPRFDFDPIPHWELGESLGILDFERAAKISGSRFVVQFGAGARLERALANFMLDLHTSEHGYAEVLPPFVVNSDSLFGTGQLPKFEDDLFRLPTTTYEPNKSHVPKIGEQVLAIGQEGLFTITNIEGNQFTLKLASIPSHQITVPRQALLFNRNLWLIPTAEVPVTNLFRDETINLSGGPVSFCAYTPCFRSEAGSYGKDVRGMIRQHQFQKVELVKFTRPEDSAAELEQLTRHAETVLERLGLPYRRMLLCTGDMGFSSAKTYDLEVWVPGQNTYREISSCSNFESFQARRANIRYKPEGAKKSEFVHTLNGSGLAVGRTYLAVLENYQQADGSIRIPEALVPYMGGETVITKQSLGRAL